jgi:hypothetical protein
MPLGRHSTQDALLHVFLLVARQQHHQALVDTP